MYRTKQWLEPLANAGEPNGHSIIRLADEVVETGEPLLSEADLAVFVAAFQQGGFTAPCHWYQNFTRNWATTEQVEQRVRQPALMIYGEHDMVRKADMSAYVADLEVHTLPCGHWIQQEQPEATNRLLLDWLERRMRPLV
jgi:pimeloyl-ACP methyl ester carboxylesterase